MLFNSIEFLIFLPIVVIVYFLLNYRHRWIFLLIASYYFYMSWKPEYIILIVVSTLVDYVCGLQMGQAKNQKTKKLLLIISLVSNLGILFCFKYFNFFNDSFREVFHYYSIGYFIPDFDLLLPVGISFYTFQTLSYTIEVYRGKMQPEKHLGRFALFVSFFPQLVAGPIERASNLIPQFETKFNFDYERMRSGLLLIGWGLFKKVVIADRLALFVNEAYNNVHEYQGISFFIATVFFAFQIYCDFSGYSDIAIGTAKIMGYDLMENFKRPYFSKSVSEFWKRWHISLSTWFRDYLYIPLGGNRMSKPRVYFNLFITFLVSGLWHGANWTFVVWGGLNGLYLLFPLWYKSTTDKLGIGNIKFGKRMNVFITFSLICFAWIFFRANTIGDAQYIITHLFSGWDDFIKVFEYRSTIGDKIILLNQPKREFFVALLTIATMEIVHMIQRRGSVRVQLFDRPAWVRWTVYIGLVLAIMNLGVANEIPFIYFQF